ncbi:MAG: cytochrome c oxidase assembly protein [Pseudonocardia sp.]|uniref:cytochrome c oxidase assembly protein n=1 Tax=unclassified Pseudonocardia TaxID=2619320 RepID=UPI00086DC5D1|nr:MULTISPECIES: cytochrome c oxidase assembly protein [unclassified Pseudonocardia]MBN9108264.1 cytochrome c oxidase assembly protein [Pseudonocardia sp.]ODU25625.1 MAG: cytochrome C oxidase assembly protein [Pseudonocardia sp. SCN 72-51]ODV08658.1 MAG: cytochrome C oxidase assembly protein [Pseudonocardia sp. SCN 73-27]
MTIAAAALPPLTLARAVTAWRADPGTLAATALLVGGYLAARARRAGPVWPRARTVCFALGAASIALVGCSFLGVYDDTLFWTRATQNVVLLMVTPLLLAMGSPVRLAADLLPPGRRARWSRRLHSAPLRALTFPLVVTVVLVLPLLVLYLSPLYPLTLRSTLASALAGTVLVAAGWIYFWTRLRIDPTPRADSYLVTLWITIVEVVGDAVLGLVLWLGPLVAADHYLALHRDWGPSVRVDQVLGAGVLWAGGDVVGLPFIGIVVARMTREDEQRAEVIDAELDALEEPGPDDEGATSSGLWWEDDPQLADRFRRRPR